MKMVTEELSAFKKDTQSQHSKSSGFKQNKKQQLEPTQSELLYYRGIEENHHLKEQVKDLKR